MDINDKIAARRAELAQEEREVKAAQDFIAAREKAERDAATAKAVEERRRQTALALDEAASRLSDDSVQLVREGDHLAMKATPINTAGLVSNEIERLLRVRAREMWTVKDNWLVIGGFASCLTVISIALCMAFSDTISGILTLLCVGAGAIALLQRSQLNKLYFEKLCEQNPTLVDAMNNGLPAKLDNP